MAAVDQEHVTHQMVLQSGAFALNIVGTQSKHLEDYFTLLGHGSQIIWPRLRWRSDDRDTPYRTPWPRSIAVSSPRMWLETTSVHR